MTRDTGKDAFKALASKGAKVIPGDMADPSTLVAPLAGANAAYIVVPGHSDRTQLSLNALEACKTAKVGFVLMLSVCAADSEGEIFADQFKPLEDATKASGLKHCIVRLPMFLENIGAQVGAIKGNGQFYTPVEPSKPYNSVSVGDVGEVCANILLSAKDSTHHGKTYNVVGQSTTETDVAVGLTKATGKTVEHVKVPYDACKQSFMGMGFPEWQTDGIIELLKAINNEATWTKLPHTDTEKLLGRAPTTHEGVATYILQ